MTDDEAIRYLAGDEAEGLDPAERAELDEVRTLLADPSVWAEPAGELEERVVAAIAAEAEGRPHANDVATDTVVPLGRSRRGNRRRYVAGAVAVVAAAVLALVLVASSHHGRSSVALALTPTELIPAAKGTATITPEESGLRIQLNATGLPRRDGGLFYQAWLKNAAGDLVPIGTFHTGDHVTLWAGVSLADYPTLTVTEEQADNDQTSSGRRVLAGTVTPAQASG